MAHMTLEQIAACYERAKEVYEGRFGADAVGKLVDKHGMNEASAIMYIHFFRYCMNGERHVRSISKAGLDYYLKNVLKDYGEKQLEIFLQGLSLHIEHHQNKGKSKKSFCDLYNKYSKEIGLSQSL